MEGLEDRSITHYDQVDITRTGVRGVGGDLGMTARVRAFGAVLVIGVTVTVLVGPMLAIGLPPTRLGWMGFLALPALIVLWAWWSHLQARLALAFWQWGEPPTPVVPVEPTVSPTFAA